jgi:mono/diheme cytochrome c family protein
MAGPIRHPIQKCAMIFLFLLLLAGCGGSPAVQESPNDPEQLATGKRVYDANCAACHGVKGEGQPDWKRPVNGVFPAPPHDGSGHTWHHPDQVLLEVIANGGGVPNSAMPAYGEILTEEERVAVLEYIKTFWGKQERTYQAQMTQQRSD